MLNSCQMLGDARSHEVTGLLAAWRGGDEDALNQLVPLIYSELHRLAHYYMRAERPGHALQTTALINEAYLRVADAKLDDCPDRNYFLGVCARVMRQVLTDWARTQQSLKRKGNLNALELNESILPAAPSNPDLLAIDEALGHLADVDARKAQIVELRFFGGLSVDEIAKVLDVSVGTVARDWTIAKAFLRRELEVR